MNKFIISSLCALALPFTLHAECKPMVLTTYAGYYVTGISPNGKWAVGYYTGGDETHYGFRWNLTNNKIELLSSGSVESEGNAISNDGVVACNYLDTEATQNGAPANSGGWWNGQFHHIQTIGDAYASSRDGNTRALSISGNGTWLGGASINGNGKRVATVWNNGQIAWTAQEDVVSRAFCVSNDGKMAAGWSTPKSAGGGWVATLWREGEAATYLSDATMGAPWYVARAFSENGKYLLYFNSYYDDTALPSGMGMNCIYNISDGTTTGVPTMTSEPYNMYLYSIANDGTVVGYEQPEDGSERAFISTGGTSHWLDDYLQEQGLDLSTATDIGQGDDGTYNIIAANGISADGQVIVARYADSTSNMRSIAFILNAEECLREPVQLQAEQLTDTKAVKVEWLEPLADADKVTGYNVYRNGTKVNDEPINQLYFYDAVPATGSYTYTVTAVYAAGESEASEAVVATVNDKNIEAPTRLFARQTRLNDAHIIWEAPLSNNIIKSYYTDDMEIEGFGASGLSFEGAVRFEQADLAYYQGKQLTAVTFYPLSEQNGWTINVYSKSATDGTLKTIASQTVTQALNYGQKNVVKLDEPITVPTDADLYVAVSVDSKSDAEDNVMGIVYGLINPELADLARLTTEDNFYSIYEQSLASSNPFTFTWAISAVLSDADASSDIDKVSQYHVYDADQLVATTSEMYADAENLSAGSHTFSVEAVYADGRISPRTSTTLTISPNEAKYYKAIENVEVQPVGDAAITATWQAPTDNDATTITYANETTGDNPVGPSDNAYCFQAAADYPSSMLRGMEGYQITSLRFFPLCNADFTLYLQANGEEVAQVAAEDYKLGSWNDVTLPTPVSIEAGKTYRLIVDIYDCEEETAPLGIDAQVPFMGQSDLCSVDEGESFATIYDKASVYGNWKIGFTAVSPNEKPLPVDHYEINIDGKQPSDGSVTDTAYGYDFGQEDAVLHSIRVNAVYDNYGAVRGNTTYFYIGKASGIDNATLTQLHLTTQGGVICVEGNDVASVNVYAVNGQLQAQAQGNKVSISNLSMGTYVVSIKLNDGSQRSCKVCLVR